ncbi:GNAT family N-acetyltransferase [Palleronia caenipelagi]|uniref:GNAT family N-acetyltransferase n=1 Tax=Palleronia caenipelagi TaxID=2489174 RepID=A0A547Q667_9RHOB|nr:GNAT family N-acetyltransferase [Palleronia caenipelagi]TRD21878.1 GNAT family N-acetyltransferase [Palleronia caenipelagi]
MPGDIAWIDTDRLHLRPLTPADGPALVEGVGNYDVSRWLSVVPFPYTQADAEAFVASPFAEARRCWAICRKDRPNDLMGLISIAGEIGFWLARPHWGQGYASEACAAVIDAAFADPNRKEVSISHMHGNEGSRRVIEKMGFRHVGDEERHFRALGQEAPVRLYRMTRAEWREQRGLRRSGWWSIARTEQKTEQAT